MINAGKVVSLAYALKNDSGQTLDQSSAKDPFVYLHGAGQIVPGLEKALEGMLVGMKKDVTVAPAEGYGEVDASLQLVVNRSQFPADAQLQAGMQFETRTQDGYGLIFTIAGINGDQVSIDGNHPLAGQNLHFSVEVLEIREATDEEKSHGHAHGPGDHHH